MSDPRKLMEAYYEPIVDTIVMHCGTAMNDGTDGLADNAGPANLLSLFIL